MYQQTNQQMDRPTDRPTRLRNEKVALGCIFHHLFSNRFTTTTYDCLANFSAFFLLRNVGSSKRDYFFCLRLFTTLTFLKLRFFDGP